MLPVPLPPVVLAAFAVTAMVVVRGEWRGRPRAVASDLLREYHDRNIEVVGGPSSAENMIYLK